MQKNVASQKWRVFAFDRTTSAPKTGDAANITASISIDGAALTGTNDVNPTELADGFYEFDMTQAETNGDDLLLSPSSVTANIQVIGCPACISTTPSSFGDDVIQTGDSFALIGTAGAGLTNIGDSRMANLDATVSSRLAPAGTLAAVTLVNGIANNVIDSNVLDATALTAIEDEVLDALLSGHNVAGSVGKAIRQLGEGIISAEAAINDGSATTTTFITTLDSSVDDYYNEKVLVFTDGALVGQSRIISDYAGSTKTVTLDEALTSAPADSSGFIVLATHQHTITSIQNGLATSAALATVDSNVDAIKAKTDLISASFDTEWAAVYDVQITGITTTVESAAGKHSVAGTVMMSTNASISGGTLTAKKPSDDTTFQTYTVTTTAGADPITGID